MHFATTQLRTNFDVYAAQSLAFKNGGLGEQQFGLPVCIRTRHHR